MSDKMSANDLAQVAALAVTTTGRSPSSITWEYTVDQLVEDTMNLVKSLVPAIQEVTIEVHPNTGNVMGFAWLPSRSEHLIDTTMQGVIGRTVQAYSKEVKELMEKYSPKDAKQAISPQKGTGNNLSAIPLDLVKVLSVLMDVSGQYCKSQFGTSVRSWLELRAIFRENSHTEKRLLGVSVTKSTKTAKTGKPRPNPNFRF